MCERGRQGDYHAYANMTPEEAAQHKPTVLFVDENNHIARKANYEKHGLLCDQE